MGQVIDERVVEMSFDNENFERNVQASLKTIDELKKSLKFEDAGKELDKLSDAANNIDFSKLEENVQSLADRFSTSGIVAMTAIQEITKLAGRQISNVVSNIESLIKTGGINRALNIEKAKFQLEGLGIAWANIKEDIDYGVNDTAYGLDAAANAASQLVASGVTIGDNMKTALRGISGVAAMTASSYEEISAIFTTVAGQGKLMTMQLRQLESRGLNAAAILGQQLGRSEAEVREMVTKGVISFDMFASAMDSAFGEHAKDANKTFTGVISNIKAAFGRIGASFITPFVENDGKLVHFLQSIRNTVSSFQKFIAPTLDSTARGILNIIEAVQKVGSQFTLLNGWKNIWIGIKDVLKNVLNILTPFINIFRGFTSDIEISGAILAHLARKFAEFSKSINIGTDYLGSFYDVLILISFILKTGISLALQAAVISVDLFLIGVKSVINTVIGLKSHLSELPLIVQNAVNKLSEFTGIDLSGAWSKVSDILGKIREFLEDIGVIVVDLFRNLNINDHAVQPTERVAKALERVSPLLKAVNTAATAATKIFRTLYSVLKVIATLLLGRFVSAIKLIQKFIQSIKFDDIKKGLTGIYNTIVSIADKIGSVFGKTEKIWDDYGNQIDGAFDKVKNFKDVIHDFLDNISGAGTITAYAAEPVMDLSDKYVYASDTVTKSADTIADANKKVASSAQVNTPGKESVPTLLERLVDVFDKVKPKITEFVETCKGAVSQIDMSKVIAAGIAIVMINILTKLTTAFYDLSKTISTAGMAVTNSIAGFFKSWSQLPMMLTEVAKSYAKKTVDISFSMLKISASIGILAASLWLLSEIPTEKLKQSGIVLAAIAAGVLVFAGALTVMSKVDAKNSLQGVAISLLAFSASVLIISKTLKSIYSIFDGIDDNKKFLQTVKNIGVSLGALSAIMLMLSLFSISVARLAPQLTAGSLFLISFGIAIKFIGQALTNLADKNNYENMEEALNFLGSIMLMLSVLALACSRMKFTSAIGVFLVIHAISKIQDMMIDIGNSELSFTYIKDHLEQFAIVLGVIAAVSVALMASGKYATQGAIAVVLLSFMAERLVDCIMRFQKVLESCDIDSMKTAILGLMAVMVSLGALLAIISVVGKNALGASLGISLLLAVTTGLVAVLFYLAKSYSASVLDRVEGALLCMTMCLGGLVYVSQFTKDVKVSALIAMSGMLLFLVGSLVILSSIKDSKGLLNAATGLSLVLASLGIALAGASMISKDVNMKAIIGIVSTAAVAAIGLYALCQVDMDKLLAATLSLGIVLTTLICGFNTIEEGTKGKLAGVLLIAMTLGSIVAALWVLAQYSWESLLSSAASLSLVMLSIAGCFTLISDLKFSWKSAGIVLEAVIALGAIAGSLYLLCQVDDYNKVLSAANSITEVLLALTATIGILSVVGAAATGAIIGIGVLDLLILDIIGMIALIGWMYQSEGFQSIIADGGEALGAIGNAIGNFIGGFVGGTVSKFTESLPQIGTNLSTFGENIQGFISSISGIDQSTVSSAKMLVDTIAAMAGASFVSGLSGIFGSSDPFAIDKEGFGEKLATLGAGIKTYAESIRGMEQGDVDKVKLSAEALNALVDVAKAIPNTGGLLGEIVGDNDIDDFASRIVPYGMAIVRFSHVVVGLTSEHVAAIERTALASQALTDFAKTIPNSGGWLGEIVGDNDIDDFGEMIKKYARAILNAGGICLEIKSEHITAIDNVREASVKLVSLANSLENSGGVISWFTGDNTLEKFGASVVEFASYMTTFVSKTVTISWTDLNEAVDKVRAVVSILTSISDVDTNAFGKLNLAMANASELAVDSFNKALKQTGVDSIARAIKNAINDAVDISTIDCKSSFYDMGKTFGEELANGLESTEDGLQGGITALVNGALNAIDDSMNAFRSAGARAGQAVIDGFGGDDGIDPYPESEKAYNILDAVKNAAVNWTKNNVPTLYNAGANSGDGFISGITSSVGTGISGLVDKYGEYSDKIKGYGSILDFFGIGNDSSSSDSTTNAINSVTDALTGTAGAATGAGSAATGAGSAVSSATNATKKSLNIIDYAQSLIYKYRDSYIALTSAISETEALNTSKSDIQEFAVSVYEAMGNTVEYTEDGITKILENFQTFTKDFQKNIKEQMSSTEEFTQSFDISPKSISKNLETNQSAIDNYLRYIRQAARNGIDKDTIINLINGGFSQESYNKVRVYASMTKAEIASFNQSIADAATLSEEKMTSTLTSVIASYNGAINNINEKTVSWKSTTGMAVTEIISTLERAKLTYDEQLQAISDTLAGTIANFNEFSIDEDNAMTADKMEENLESRINAVNEWSEAMQDLLDRGISKELYEKLRDMGWEDGYTYVMALKEASDEQLDSISDKFLEAMSMEGIDSGEISSQIASKAATVWTEGLGDAIKGIGEALVTGNLTENIGGAFYEVAKQSVAQYWGDLSELMNSYGVSYSPEFAKSIEQALDPQLMWTVFHNFAAEAPNGMAAQLTSEASKKTVSDAAINLMTEAIGALDESRLEETGSLEKLQSACRLISNTMAATIVKDIRVPADAAGNLSQAIVETTEGIISLDKFIEIGNYIIDGLKESIYDGKAEVISAMREMCQEAIDAATDEFDINSPSKVMQEIGKYVDQGFGIGISKNTSSITDSITALSDTALDAFNGVIIRLSDYLENGINAEPVITPVLDMSNMDAGLAYANSLAGKNFKMGSLSGRAYNLMSSIGDHGSDTNNTSKGGNSYQFIQNNYSPKALSRVDIYRQTNNQFTRMKGLVEAG